MSIQLKAIRYVAFINIVLVFCYYFLGGLNESIPVELVAYNHAYYSELMQDGMSLFSVFIVISSVMYVISLIGLLIGVSFAEFIFYFGIFFCYSLKFYLGPYVDHPINVGLNSVSMFLDGIIFWLLISERFGLSNQNKNQE